MSGEDIKGGTQAQGVVRPFGVKPREPVEQTLVELRGNRLWCSRQASKEKAVSLREAQHVQPLLGALADHVLVKATIRYIKKPLYSISNPPNLQPASSPEECRMYLALVSEGASACVDRQMTTRWRSSLPFAQPLDYRDVLVPRLRS